MGKTFRALTTIALLALPGALAAQPGAGGPPEGEIPGGPPPFEALVRVRDELDLSDAQVARLTAIGRAVEARNRPLRARLTEVQRRHRGEVRERMERLTPRQRRDTLRAMRAGQRPLPPEMERLVAEMRANVRRGMREAQGVLTPGQKARARALIREHAGPEGRRGGQGMRGRGERMRGRGRAGPPPGRP